MFKTIHHHAFLSLHTSNHTHKRVFPILSSSKLKPCSGQEHKKKIGDFKNNNFVPLLVNLCFFSWIILTPSSFHSIVKNAS